MPEHVTDATNRPRRPGRPRTSDLVLTREVILSTALALVDEQGVEALSMRRLATRLHVDPMSIYHHVPNKTALVAGLVQMAFAAMAPPAVAGPWPERVRAWAHAYRALTLAHPNLVLQIVSDAATTSEAAILTGEPLYAALVDAGLEARAVVQAAGTLVDYVHGYALAFAGGPTTQPGDTDPIGTRLAAMAPGLAPTIRRIHAALTDTPTTRDDFDAGLDTIIRGITRQPIRG